MKKLLPYLLVHRGRRYRLRRTVADARERARQLRAPLQIGSVVPELLDPGLQDLTFGLMKNASLADVGRITVTWQKGQRAMDPGLLGDLRTGVDKATVAGIDIYLDVYPNGSSQTPNRPPTRPTSRPGRRRSSPACPT